ncbi:MAG: hypothetical protein R3F17_02110 [Planctomycetota bacterium]
MYALLLKNKLVVLGATLASIFLCALALRLPYEYAFVLPMGFGERPLGRLPDFAGLFAFGLGMYLGSSDTHRDLGEHVQFRPWGRVGIAWRQAALGLAFVLLWMVLPLSLRAWTGTSQLPWHSSARFLEAIFAMSPILLSFAAGFLVIGAVRRDKGRILIQTTLMLWYYGLNMFVGTLMGMLFVSSKAALIYAILSLLLILAAVADRRQPWDPDRPVPATGAPLIALCMMVLPSIVSFGLMNLQSLVGSSVGAYVPAIDADGTIVLAERTKVRQSGDWHSAIYLQVDPTSHQPMTDGHGDPISPDAIRGNYPGIRYQREGWYQEKSQRNPFAFRQGVPLENLSRYLDQATGQVVHLTQDSESNLTQISLQRSDGPFTSSSCFPEGHRRRSDPAFLVADPGDGTVWAYRTGEPTYQQIPIPDGARFLRWLDPLYFGTRDREIASAFGLSKDAESPIMALTDRGELVLNSDGTGWRELTAAQAEALHQRTATDYYTQDTRRSLSSRTIAVMDGYGNAVASFDVTPVTLKERWKARLELAAAFLLPPGQMTQVLESRDVPQSPAFPRVEDYQLAFALWFPGDFSPPLSFGPWSWLAYALLGAGIYGLSLRFRRMGVSRTRLGLWSAAILLFGWTALLLAWFLESPRRYAPIAPTSEELLEQNLFIQPTTAQPEAPCVPSI